MKNIRNWNIFTYEFFFFHIWNGNLFTYEIPNSHMKPWCTKRVFHLWIRYASYTRSNQIRLDESHLSAYRDMVDVTKTRRNLGYFFKQIENNFRIFALWYKHGWRHFNRKNTRKHSEILLGIFPVEMTSFLFLITAQRHSSNFLFVKWKIYIWKLISHRKFSFHIWNWNNSRGNIIFIREKACEVL